MPRANKVPLNVVPIGANLINLDVYNSPDKFVINNGLNLTPTR